MISIVLEDVNCRIVTRICQIGNEDCLVGNEDLELLSGISESSYSVFGPDNMPKLIGELELLKTEVGHEQQIKHLDEIIALANQCRSEKNLVLSFTPFE